VSGLGKGVVGTVTKPVAGVLDFASGTASAIRDTSKSHIHRRPLRARRPRCCYGHGGLLVPYSAQSAEAQEELLRLNGHNYAERFVIFIFVYHCSITLHNLGFMLSLIVTDAFAICCKLHYIFNTTHLLHCVILCEFM